MANRSQSRALRLGTARTLLIAFKQAGGSAKLAASYLGVSPTMLSHWRSVASAKNRSIGAPTEEHLMKLTALVSYQMRMNLEVLWSCLSELGHGYGYLNTSYILNELTPVLEEYATKCRHELGRSDHMFDDLIGRMREIHRKYGEEAALMWFMPEYVDLDEDHQRVMRAVLKAEGIDWDKRLEELRITKLEVAEFAQHVQEHMLAKRKPTRTPRKGAAKVKRRQSD